MNNLRYIMFIKLEGWHWSESLGVLWQIQSESLPTETEYINSMLINLNRLVVVSLAVCTEIFEET